MKKLIFTAVFLFFTANLMQSFACTNFIVTKGASKDGSVMVSYSADSHTLYGELYHWARATYPLGTMMDVIEWDSGKKLGQIPQATQTYNVVGNMNEFQVCIAETTYGGLKELETPNGIMDYGSLIYLTLQRVKSAREAIKCISDLLDNHGYASSGESFSIIDKNEAWVFEIIGKGEPMLDAKGKPVKGWTKGAVWVARLIPDGYVSGHANQARIQTFPLADGKTSITNKQFDKMLYNPEVTTIYSWDVVSFAKLKGLYAKESSDAAFSFSDTYAPVDFSAARYCEARVWAGFYRLNPKEMAPYEKYARGEELTKRMPLWIKPVEKVDVRQVMNLMRDHYEGTSMDMTKDLGAGPFECPYRWRPMTWELDGKKYLHERATATQQTGFSFIGQARSKFPDVFGGILWFGVDDAASSCYVPMFCSIKNIPDPFKVGNGSMVEYSPTSAFWTFTKVSNFAYTRYNAMIKHIKEKQEYWENKSIEDIKMMENHTEVYKAEPEKMVDILNKFCIARAKDVVNEWNSLFEYLLVKYHDGNIKKEENGKFKTNENVNPQAEFPEQPRYPDSWYRMIVNDCGSNILYGN